MIKFKLFFSLILTVVLLIGCSGRPDRPVLSPLADNESRSNPPSLGTPGGGEKNASRNTKSDADDEDKTGDDGEQDESEEIAQSGGGIDLEGPGQTTSPNNNQANAGRPPKNTHGVDAFGRPRIVPEIAAGGGAANIRNDDRGSTVNSGDSNTSNDAGGGNDDLGGGGLGNANNAAGNDNRGGREDETTDDEPKSFFESAEEAFGQTRDSDGFQYLYAHALTDDRVLRETPMSWFNGWSENEDRKFNEPRLGLRWGVGIVYKLDGDLDGDPPVIGDSDSPSGTNAAGRGNSNVDDIAGPPSGGGGSIAAPPRRNLFNQGAGASTAAGNRDRSDTSSLTPHEEIVFYTGDYGRMFLERLDSRRTHEGGFYGKLLAEINAKAAGNSATDATSNRNDEQQNLPSGALGGFDDLMGISGGSGGGITGNPNNQPGTNVGSSKDDEGSGGGPKTGTQPGVSLVGVDKLETLIRNAASMGIDVLAVFEVDIKHSSRTNRSTNTTRLALYSVKHGELIKRGKALTLAKVAKDRETGRGDDPVDIALDEIFQNYADKQWRGTEFPSSLKKEHVDSRIETLVDSKPVNPLPALVEIRQYYVMDYIDKFELANAFEALIGSDTAKILVEGNEDSMRAAMAKWMPGNFNAGPRNRGRFR